MFVGHLGVGLALSSRSRRFRLGPLLGATLLLDVLLGVFVLAGMEQVIVPPDFATGHFLEFVFPYSHGLLSSVLWASLTAAMAGAGWLLLGRAPLPPGSPGWRSSRTSSATRWSTSAVCPPRRGLSHVGLGVWRAMPWALALEVLLLAGGVALFLRSREGLSRARRAVLLGVLGLLAVLQVEGQLGGALPPPTPALAVSWLVQSGVLVLLGLWADPAPVSAAAEVAPAG